MFAIFISKRLRLGSAGRGVSAGMGVSIAAIAVAVAVMLISIAVTHGFQQEIRRKLAGFEAEVTLAPASSYYGDTEARIAYSGGVKKAVENVIPPTAMKGLSVSASWSLSGILKTDNDFLGVRFKAYGKGHDWGFEKENLVEGEFPEWGSEESKNEVVLSKSMADKLSLEPEDKVYAYFIGEDGNVRARRLKIVGLYNSNFGEYDGITAYASPQLIAPLAGQPANNEAGLELGQRLEMRGLGNAPQEALALQTALNTEYMHGGLEGAVAVDTVYRTAAGYFNWLDLLDANVVAILVLMGCVSGFTLIAALMILILERVKMTGLLKALGTTSGTLRWIFTLLGGRVLGWGLLIGNLLALGLIGVQYAWHIIPLNSETYYLSYVPVAIEWWEVALLDCAVVAVAFLLLLIPTTMIGRIAPATTLRWE